MFISPSQEQTLKFCNTRLGKTINYSPLIRKYYVDPNFSNRILLRMFRNGSEMASSFALDDPDRARGISADRVAYDEFQDILYDAVVPVVNECMSNSNYAYETYAGTPKTMEASIQYLWDKSSQTEWVIKCDGCGKYTFFVDKRVVGLKGPICLKPDCGKYLDVRKGQWVDMQKGASVKGYHINQLMLPLNVPLCADMDGTLEQRANERWERIREKLDDYSEAKFNNEVLGISDSIGSRLISKDELESLCIGPQVSPYPTQDIKNGVHTFVAGIDWSGGGTEGISRTVVWIWGIKPDHSLVTAYFKIFPVGNPVADVDEIIEVLTNYHVPMVVGDAGEGSLANSLLQSKLGQHRAIQVQYGAFKKPLNWNGVDRYLGDRTTLIDNFLMTLKRKGASYPANLPLMRDPIQDILNVYEQVTAQGKRVWRHSPTLPDDCLHAQLFGWLAAKIISQNLKFL